MAVAEDLDVMMDDDEGRRRGGGFFGVIFSPRTYGAIFYMLLSLPLGVLYFTTVVTGISISIPMLLLVVGLVILPLFMLIVRFLSLTEGYITQTLLGANIPVRDFDEVAEADDLDDESEDGASAFGRFWSWFKRSFSDARSYTSMIYMLLMLPLGIAYFTIAVTGFAVSFAFIAAPIAKMLGLSDDMHIHVGDADPGFVVTSAEILNSPAGVVIMMVGGLIGLILMLYISRGLGWFQARLAELMLVKRTQ